MRYSILVCKKKVLSIMQERRWLRFHGIFFILLCVILFLNIPGLQVPIPDAIPLLLTEVVYAAFVGGIIAGTVSALISLSYDSIALSLPHDLFHYSLIQEERLLLLVIISPLLAFFVGSLRLRIERSHTDVEQRVRGRTAQLEATAQTERLARAQVDALFEAIADSVIVFNREGHVLRMNQRAREHLQHYAGTSTLPTHQRWLTDLAYDEAGHAIVGDADLLQRVLNGEVLTGANTFDLKYPTNDGGERWVSVSGAPTFDSMNKINGAIMVVRDVTEQHRARQQTQDSLEALLMLAEEMVMLPTSFSEQALEHDNASVRMERIAQRLVILIRNVLNCQRVSITLLDPQTQAPRSVAVVGIPAEQEQQWKERRSGYSLSEIMSGLSLTRKLGDNEVVIVDFTQPPLCDRPNPYRIQKMLLSPMMVSTVLVGVLALDYGPVLHTYNSQEQGIARAVGKLAGVIVERERLLAEWAEARGSTLALQESNQLMDEFIGIAGHELRTPLTTIKASVQLALRQLHKTEQRNGELSADIQRMMGSVQDLLERTERQVNMQNRLVGDLLDVSRIHSDRLELHPDLCDITKIVRDTVIDQRDLTPQRTIQLDADNERELLVLADADRVRQVVSNYLSNALKYSSSDKPVAISIIEQDNEVRVQVRDEGPGLTENQQAHIWDRFYRVPGIEVRSGSGVGLGLGLHICKTIIERQGGHVGVESVPGGGSTFWFVLPLTEV